MSKRKSKSKPKIRKRKCKRKLFCKRKLINENSCKRKLFFVNEKGVNGPNSSRFELPDQTIGIWYSWSLVTNSIGTFLNSLLYSFAINVLS